MHDSVGQLCKEIDISVEQRMHYGFLEDTPVGQWVPDILDGFSRHTIRLGEDDEGPLSATLVRYDAAEGHPVLYIHGWSDYFYNTELAMAAADHGYKLYALDLRKYGRSLRNGQSPGYVEDLAEYDDEIGSALAIIKLAHPDQLPAIIAHSTGGLVASLWAHRHPQQISTLDRKSTRLNSSHVAISYAVFCLKKKQ